MHVKIRIRIGLTALLAALTAGCGSDGESLPRPREVRFAQERYDLLPGQVRQATLLMRFEDAEMEYDPELDLYKVGWQSSDDAVVRVSARGEVTAVGYGTATLTARSSRFAAPVTASVRVRPEALQLERERYTLAAGSTVHPQLILSEGGEESPSDDRFGMTWRTGDERIATVAADGTVTGCGYGTTTLFGASPLLDRELTAEITVELEGLRFDRTEYTLDIGETARPLLLVTENGTESDAGERFGIAWKIDDERIASLAADGTVTGLRGGTTSLTATTSSYSRIVSARIIVRGGWSGEWMLALWNGGDAMAGSVYLNLADDGTFTLYQSIDRSGFACYRGRYTLTPQGTQNVLTGTYDDGTGWKERYYLTRNGDNLVLTAVDGGDVSEYERREIPDYVKGPQTAAAAKALRTTAGRFL